MRVRTSTAGAILGAVALVLTATLALAGPALAGHGAEHGQSDGSGQSGQAHGGDGSQQAPSGGGEGNADAQGSNGQAAGGGAQGEQTGQGGNSDQAKSDQASSDQADGGRAKDNDGDADNDRDTSYTEDNDNDGRRNADDPTPSKHPSGKDKYLEPGGSGNQGKSESDPDGMSNGGADKPNGTGGEDIYDQDGNNGCGNDQDFEDDNNGWCGKPKDDEKRAEAEQIEVEAAAAMAAQCPDSGPAMVTGTCGVSVAAVDAVIAAGAPATIEVSGDAATAADAEVLGERIERPAARPEAAVAPATLASRLAGGILPFTGSDVATVVAVGIALIAAGLLIARRRSATE